MNREIKFRAYVPPNTVQIYEYKKGVSREYTQKDPGEMLQWGEFDLSAWLKNGSAERVMQYTGLHDKNGNEIYEGDVVQLLEITGKVIWSEYSSAFQIEFWLDGFLALRGAGNGAIYKTEEEYYDMMEVDCDQLIIIGNIYEHGHLLDNTGVEV